LYHLKANVSCNGYRFFNYPPQNEMSCQEWYICYTAWRCQSYLNIFPQGEQKPKLALCFKFLLMVKRIRLLATRPRLILYSLNQGSTRWIWESKRRRIHLTEKPKGPSLMVISSWSPSIKIYQRMSRLGRNSLNSFEHSSSLFD